MVTVYVDIDDSGKIVRCDTNQIGNLTPIEVDDEMAKGVKILSCYYKDGEVILDEDDYSKVQQQKTLEKNISLSRSKFKAMQESILLTTLSDNQAYEVRYLYDSWEPNKSYVVGDRMLYGDNLYKCKQNHTSEDGPNRTPDYLPALWDLIAPDDPTIGTKDNPIIIPEPFSSMEYAKGKYYKEGDVLYLMNREGMADGEKVSLTYKPSQLVEHYFEIVTEV